MPSYDWSTRLTTGEVITCTAVAAATTATAGIYADLPAAAPLATTAATAAGTAVYSARKHVTRTTIGVRVASWLTAGGWSSYHLATETLPGTPGWISAACAGILAFALNYAATTTEPERAKQEAVLAFKKQASRTLDEWGKRIERVGHIKGATCTDMQPWPKEAGYTLKVKLPGGTTWKELAAQQDSLAADLDLPDGCGVEVAKGPTRGVAIVRVSTRDMISETVMVEEDFSPLSFTESFAFGMHRDGTEALMSLLDDCGLLIGKTGSGKTNLLNAIIMQLARMPDVLVWVIDVTGAGVALPWVAPWAIQEDGRTVQASAPAVDWVAHTRAEAKLMLALAIQIIEIRKARYQRLMRQHNTDKLPISADLPAILIVTDETAELSKDDEGNPDMALRNQLDTVVNTGRATRVRTLSCALRATQDSISAAMKKQADVRVGMSVTDPEELSYLFTGHQTLDPADAPCPGSGFHANAALSPRPFKAKRITPTIITDGTIATAGRRAQLDEISGTAKLHSKYATRWLRSIPALFPDEYQEGSIAEEVEQYLKSLEDGDTTNTLPGDTTPEEAPMDAAMQAAMDTPSIEQLQEMLDEANTTNAEEAPAFTQDPPHHEAQRILSDSNVIPLHKTPAAPSETGGTATLTRPPQAASAKDQAYAYVQQAGPDGAGAQEISDWLQKPRTTVQGWLTTWAQQNLVTKIGSGSHAKYTAQQDR